MANLVRLCIKIENQEEGWRCRSKVECFQDTCGVSGSIPRTGVGMGMGDGYFPEVKFGKAGEGT